jgi:hypothetical protein
MPAKARSRDSGDSKLTAAVATKVFGWKNVHKRDGKLIGKRQDKAGRWRRAKVPDYANDQRQSYAIDERMKQLGRTARYLKELAKITKATNLPSEWATAEQRSRAALKALET